MCHTGGRTESKTGDRIESRSGGRTGGQIESGYTYMVKIRRKNLKNIAAILFLILIYISGLGSAKSSRI